MCIFYKIEFFSDWHCGTGQTSGADTSALVITDEYGFPYIPGKTLKGLLREAAENLTVFAKDKYNSETMNDIFGVKVNETPTEKESIKDPSVPGKAVFSNGELTENLKKHIDKEGLKECLFRITSSTAIDKAGQAKDTSLRKTQVTVPLPLFAKINNVNDSQKELLKNCMKWVKRLGQNRNRGLGRCQLSVIDTAKEEKQS